VVKSGSGKNFFLYRYYKRFLKEGEKGGREKVLFLQLQYRKISQDKKIGGRNKTPPTLLL
jgi:hypothetical protein